MIRINGKEVGEVKGLQIVPKLPGEGTGYFVKVLGEIDIPEIDADKIQKSKVMVIIVEK